MSAYSDAEAGFSLIETLLATVLFVVVAFGGFEAVRQLGWTVDVLAQRASAAAQLAVASATLRSDALSAVAIWQPASTCGDAVELMQRDAGGTTFLLYVARGSAFVRARAAGPLDPCDPQLQTQTLIAAIDGVTVRQFAASGLAGHIDPVSGNADGTMLIASGIVPVAVASHALAIDGTPVLTGNAVTEVTLDADPVRTTIDLVAGNRPTAYTNVLQYTCNGRCEAGAPFPEIRNAPFIDCTLGYDFANTAAYYVPAAYGTVSAGSGARIVVTAYTIVAGYTFSFGGPVPLTVERAWSPAVWPPPSSPLAGSIADPYSPVYATAAPAVRGPAQLAADLGEPATFAAELQACSDMHADPTYRDATR